MVEVTLWGTMKVATGGKTKVEIDAANIQELLTKLGEDYPGLRPFIKAGIAVSIDGTIYRETWFQPIPKDAEIFLLPRLTGG
jgi:sulfur-carrier protein